MSNSRKALYAVVALIGAVVIGSILKGMAEPSDAVKDAGGAIHELRKNRGDL